MTNKRCEFLKFNLVLFKYRLSLGLLLSYTIVFIASAQEITMAFGKNIPPYIFEQENKGIEIDIISASLAYKGHTLKPHYFPLSRIPIAFKNKQVDAVMGDMGDDLMSFGGFYAEPAVTYENVFISLKGKNIKLKTPNDLDFLKVVAFQEAVKRYPLWLKKVKDEYRLLSISDQIRQVKLLNLGRYDVVLSDRYIFKYFAKQVRNHNIIEVGDYHEHQFTTIDPNHYRPVFRDKNIRDDFNLGLQQLKENGELKAIYQKYINL